jgi:arginyl-tRNA synthetase
LREQRLGLCARVLDVMTRTLDLLGIAVPERM